MQEQQPNQRLLPRFFRFLMSPRGQLYTKWCAYSSLGCLTLSALLADYSRLALPLIFVTIPLSYVGMASRSRRRVAQVALALWVISFNALAPALFNFGDQASQTARLQQQLIQLENQHNVVQDQQTVLQKQQTFLQIRLNNTQDSDLSDQLSTALDTTATDFSLLNDTLQYTNYLIDYTTWLLQNNERNILSTSLSESNQQAIKDNDDQIQFIPQTDASQDIQDNNALLPAPERVPFVSRAYQNTCVSGYPCVIQPEWQQPFLDGWQRISREPLSVTWIFWLSLLLALPGMFLLLPLTLGLRWVVSYRVIYNGLLANLNDSAFPEQKRLELPTETSIVKIEVTSPLMLRKQKGQSDEALEFLRLNLGPGTTIVDTFLGQQFAQQREEGLVEVRYDARTGNLVLKVKPLASQVVRREKGVKREKVKRSWKEMRAFQKTMRRFPIQLYVVVDYFAGSIEAATPIADVERLQEQRGPVWLGHIARICQEFCWWIFALVFYIALQNCSYVFFRASTTSPFLISWGLSLLIAGLVLKATELIIKKTTTRRQKAVPPGIPTARTDIAYPHI